MIEINEEIIKEVFQDREKSAKKYDYGMVIVVGGSSLYTGSPVLSAMAALRSGADIAQIIAPRRSADIGASFSPDIITFPLDGDHLLEKHLSDLLRLIRSAEIVSKNRVALVVGGGLGRDKETKDTVYQLLEETSVPVVIDADAVYALEGRKIGTNRKKTLFTPHLYEFYALTGKSLSTFSLEERGERVKFFAEKLSSTILLKGEYDFISDGETLEVNKMSIPYLTAGGTGDVLAGIAGALLARGLSPLMAGKTAAIISTKAGMLAAEEKRDSLIATDVIEKIPEAIRN